MKDENKPRTRERWALPVDFIPLTHAEFIDQQTYIRDRANELVIMELDEKKPAPKGLLAFQELALRADKAIQDATDRGSVDDSDDDTCYYGVKLPDPSAAVEA